MSLLMDGFRTTLTFGVAPGINLIAVTITPPSIDGGGPIEQTNMENIALRTRWHKQLQTLGDITGTFAFDPDVYEDIMSSVLNVNGICVVNFPDGSALTFYGYLDKFVPNEFREGERPLANCTIVVTNLDNSLVESAPAFTPAP